MINTSISKTDYPKANSIKLDELHAIILSIKNAISSFSSTTQIADMSNKLDLIDSYLEQNVQPILQENRQSLIDLQPAFLHEKLDGVILNTSQALELLNNQSDDGGSVSIDLTPLQEQLNLLQFSINEIAEKLNVDTSGLDPDVPYQPAPDVVYQTHHTKVLPCNYEFNVTSGKLEEEYYFQNDNVPSIMQIEYDILAELAVEFTVYIKVNDVEVFRKNYSIAENKTTHLTHFATYISDTTENKVQLFFECNQLQSIIISNISYTLNADNAFFIQYTPKYTITSLQSNYYIIKYEKHTISYLTTPANNIDLTGDFVNYSSLKNSCRFKPFALMIYTSTASPKFNGLSGIGKDLLKGQVLPCYTKFESLKTSPVFTNVVDFDVASFICVQTASYFAYIDGSTNTIYLKWFNSSRSNPTAVGSYTPTTEGEPLCVAVIRNHATHSSAAVLDGFTVVTYKNGDNILYNKTFNISHNLGKGTYVDVSMPYFVNTACQYIRVFMYEIDHWICKLLKFTGKAFEVVDYFSLDGKYIEVHGGIYDDYFLYFDNQLVRESFSGSEHSLDVLHQV